MATLDQVDSIPCAYYPEQSKFISARDYLNLLKECLKSYPVNKKIDFHVFYPYCKKKCYFCFCNVGINYNYNVNERYVSYLLKNINFFSQVFKTERFNNLLLGSGSCNLLTENQLELILKALYDNYSFFEESKTVEIFPDHDFNENKLKILAKYKINKISIGIESFNSKALKLANREYRSFQEIKKNIEMINYYDILINLDFILGLYGTTISDLLKDLTMAVKLKVSIITVYTLQPTRTYVNLVFKNKDSFFKHMNVFDKKVSLINLFMEKLGYHNYAPNSSVNIYYNKYYDKNRKYYFDYPFFKDYYKDLISFAIGKFSPNKLVGKYFITNKSDNKNYDFKEDEKIFETLKYSSNDFMLDFIISYLGRNMSIPIKIFYKIFNEELLLKYGKIQNYIDNDVLLKQNDNIKFNDKLLLTDRIIYLNRLIKELKG